jgi:type I restriction enzyme, R subunit
VEIVSELVHELDADGKQLRVVKLTDYTAEKVRTLCASPDELRIRWSDARQRADIIDHLAERGIDFASVAAQTGQRDADPFDLLCHLAFNAPVITRRQRADSVKKKQAVLATSVWKPAKSCTTCWRNMPPTANSNSRCPTC